MTINIAALRETADDERRVAITPETAAKLCGNGIEVWLERGAGEPAGFVDAAYKEAHLVDADAALARADLLFACNRRRTR